MRESVVSSLETNTFLLLGNNRRIYALFHLRFEVTWKANKYVCHISLTTETIRQYVTMGSLLSKCHFSSIPESLNLSSLPYPCLHLQNKPLPQEYDFSDFVFYISGFPHALRPPGVSHTFSSIHI